MDPTTLKHEIKDYFWSHRIHNPLNVTFTQKQKYNGFWIDDYRSEQNFRHFKNLLNTLIFGNSYRRFGKQLHMIVVRETSSNHRHHLHCIIEHPRHIQYDEFVSMIRKGWSSTNFGYDQIHIEKPSSQQREDGWLNYIMKDHTKVSLDNSIDWTNTTVPLH
jgi:hypothetical protein